MKNKKARPFASRAVVLLSGGLDSATALYFAKERGFKCFCLIFDYGQRHLREIESAREIAKSANCSYQILKIKLPWSGSALLDNKIKIPSAARSLGQRGIGKIPVTYVPARNLVFLSFALSYAEAVNAEAIFIGAHTQDYSGYPDCRPEFYRAFAKVISTGTKAGVEKKKIKINTPLINLAKSKIIRLAAQLGVPLELTWSCYQGKARPCGRCDSCIYRARGFKEAGISDPLIDG
jgi:7-cyano-7-deazaguanine synthase